MGKGSTMSKNVSISNMDFLAATHVEGLDEVVGSLKLLKKSVGERKKERDTIRRVKTCAAPALPTAGSLPR